MTIESYFQDGLEKSKNKNFLGAIEDFTMAIKLCTDSSPNIAEIYFRRAVANFQIQNPNKAASDLIKAGELNPKYHQGLLWEELSNI